MNAPTFAPLPSRLMRAKPGDLLGFSTCSALGAVINLATVGVPFWHINHVAILTAWEDRERPIVFESTTLADQPCMLQGHKVNGVQAHELAAYVASYPGKVWLYPLTIPLTTFQRDLLAKFCRRALGTPYDCLGAFRSRALGFWERRIFGHGERLNALFCSEFVAAALRTIGEFNTRNASRWNPNRLVRELVRRRVCLPRQRIK